MNSEVKHIALSSEAVSTESDSTEASLELEPVAIYQVLIWRRLLDIMTHMACNELDEFETALQFVCDRIHSEIRQLEKEEFGIQWIK